MTVIRRHGLVVALVAEPSDDLWIEIWRERDGVSILGAPFDAAADELSAAVDEWFDDHGAELVELVDGDGNRDVRDEFIVETAWLNRVRVTEGANPAVMPGAHLTRLPGGDYQLSDGERCWAFTPAEWVDHAVEYVEHLGASELTRYVRHRVDEVAPPDTAELTALLDEIRRRAEREQEGISAAVRMWRERCRYELFLAETLGPLPAMPDGWESEGERGAC